MNPHHRPQAQQANQRETGTRLERERLARELARSKVFKTLRPGQSGAIKLTRQYGTSLVCVRHRQDTLGLFRYTTVELLISQRLIHTKRFASTRHGVRLHYTEKELRGKLLSAGARWDPRSRLWWTTGAKLIELELLERISTTARRGPNIKRKIQTD